MGLVGLKKCLYFKAFKETAAANRWTNWKKCCSVVFVLVKEAGPINSAELYKPHRWASLVSSAELQVFTEQTLAKKRTNPQFLEEKQVCAISWSKFQKKEKEGINILVTSQVIHFQVSRLTLSIHSVWLWSHTVSAIYVQVHFYLNWSISINI